MTELLHLTTVEAAAHLKEASIALIPIGAVEQHGPHLELGTDAIIADSLSREVDRRLGTASVLCPTLHVGVSEHHMGFAGTLTLRPATLQAYLTDICGSLIDHGMSRILIINGHGGNVDIARVAAREVRRNTGCRVAHVMWASVLAERARERFEDGNQYFHACEVETSLAAACDASLLRSDGFCPAEGRAPTNGYTDSPFPHFDLPMAFNELSEDGALGDPSRYDEQWGIELRELFVERTVAFARWFTGLDDEKFEGK